MGERHREGERGREIKKKAKGEEWCRDIKRERGHAIGLGERVEE